MVDPTPTLPLLNSGPERFLLAWLRSNSVFVSFGSESSADALSRSIVINPNSYSGSPSLLHESNHIWLGLRRPGFSNHFINSPFKCNNSVSTTLASFELCLQSTIIGIA